MKASLILANHVEQQGNVVSLLSAGVDRALVPEGHPGPYLVQLGLALFLELEGTEPTRVTLVFELRHRGGAVTTVTVPDPQGSGSPVSIPLRLGPLVVGATGGDEVADGRTRINLGASVANFAVAELGAYEWVAVVDGVDVASAAYHVAFTRQPPQLAT